MLRNRYTARLVMTVGILLAGTTQAAWARFRVPPPCKNVMSVEQEQTEGAKYAAEIFKQMPVLPDNSALTQYVRQLGEKLVAVTPGYRWPFNFHVVASDEINAFALPGGAMFVNVGAIRAAETEAQLAGVMAHEISHVVMRHSTCNMTKQQSVGTWAALGQLGAAIALGNGALGSMASQGIGMVAGLGFLRMSRDYEKQADLLGTDILYDAGFDPRGLPQFFETIQAKYGEGGAQIFSDHPNPGNRMEYVKAEIATLPKKANPVVTSAAFTRARTLANNEKTYNGKEIAAGGWKQSGKYALLPGGPAQVIPASSGAGNGGAQGDGGAARLSKASLGLDSRIVFYNGSAFSISYPSSWQKGEGENGSVAFMPQNGAGQAGIAYGAIVENAKFQSAVNNADVLAQATNAIIRQMSEQNGGLRQIGGVTNLTINGQPANSVELQGKSPVMNGNSPLSERDMLVVVARPDGALTYMIFVAPEPDFLTLKPTFQSMAQSLRIR
ncbi:M48 family metallopeptidase [Edaphobacter albus]|uniref:M48 family metallopeptidase n=1 Tax=Edaphobacter sp. 4G125 TaxID=2763071 RepID=UPI0016472687|nr:M48 family metallopeptidase [Edaphobacter sp. 4G125]QNI37439.1 M48 family metalloprotease [Edaphobacter sp. 4G125]